ncbi:hypothetical protein [Roseivivax isoporae]|uniref:hypothetical protein n=1 Tax=Roseivivax isoporae TaxID=591206 RepID=UPI0004B51E11|nr:hypothetical protein [Roseivivax isoporae]
MTHIPSIPRPSERTLADALPLLLLSACPLLFWLLDGSLLMMLGAVFHFALLVGGALLIGAGHRRAQGYDAAEAAARPRVPRKLLGSALLGLLVFLLAAAQFTVWLPPVALGLAGFGFAVAAFGADPLRDKGLDDPTYLGRKAAEALLTETDGALRDIVDRVAGLGDPNLALRTEAMHGAILRLLRAFSADPGQLLDLERPLDKFLRLASAEVGRLEHGWRHDRATAAQSYATRLAALTAAFETGARQRRQRATPDTYALDADLLLQRMGGHAAA